MSYVSDVDGIRVKSTVNGVATHYLVDKNRPYAQVLEERTLEGDLLANYTYGHDLLSQKRGLENRYFHYDRLGSTKGLTDENQIVTDACNYEAFGNLLQVAGTTSNHYRFTGEQHEPQTGLIYLRARYYDPATGRFITQDTWQGQRGKPITLHKYLYANGNPVVFTDPTGQMSLASITAGLQIRSILTRIWTDIYRRHIKKWLKSKKYHVFKGTQNIPRMSENPEAHHFVYVEKKFQRKGMRFDVMLNKSGMSQPEF
jgi:RHS repeat-associated protein